MEIVFYLLINLPINTYIKLQQMLNYVYYRKYIVYIYRIFLMFLYTYDLKMNYVL